MSTNRNEIEKIAIDILNMSRDSLIVNMRFLDVAISKLSFKLYEETLGTDGRYVFFNPKHIVSEYKKNKGRITRLYLHTLLHCIFQHPFINPNTNRDLWDLACDIAVENMINGFELSFVDIGRKSRQSTIISELKEKCKILTAEKVYRYLNDNQLPADTLAKWISLFSFDDHDLWYKSDDYSGDGAGSGNSNDESDVPEGEDGITMKELSDAGNADSLREEWKDISETLMVDLETFSLEHGNESADMLQNLKAINRERYDYTDFLKKFATLGEIMKINDDEFDYIFYTYGLMHYKKMPLIEPLEYKEVKRIKEFVIAIDTSGSVWESMVQKFLTKTYSILHSEESFFAKINVHIIQCDSSIQEDYRITSLEEFDNYIQNFHLKGGGGTDFRPVFEHVNRLIDNHELSNLKGLIYLTDGMGDYPQKKTDYQTAFVFLDNQYNDYNVPAWAMKLILSEEDI